ncbi:MAG: hypothetical protein MJ240_04495 [Kiritimatiellae bacterium]|nr:hypothetical protein [Kiritimatiellia bacterium]
MFSKHLKARIACILAGCALATGAAETCADGVCPLPAAGGAREVAVYSPVPASAVTPVEQGPRLKTLEGKTLALVGGSFMASVTHPELKRLILAEYPTAKVYLLGEIGSAGPYPRPGMVRREKDEFQRRLKEFKVDAVIAGNGGCGLCTPKETGSCIAAEVLGIPSVMIAGPGFVKQAKNTALSAGLAIQRVAEYPGAFSSHSRDELLANTRQVLWPAIKKALTEPLADAERTPDKAEGAVHGPAITGTEAEIRLSFQDSGWTDGLPILLPTETAVAEFLKFTDLPADRSLGAIPPMQREVMVRHVAVNGVMAGCPPEFMPLLLAFVEGMKVGDFRRTLVSTHAWTPYCWLNGPVARQLGFDCGQGEISEPKNMVLGRFINLALLNLGGYRVKENRMGTFGYLTPWVLVENDEAAVKVGWKPYHMQQGHALNDSTLSCASAINWGNNLVPATTDAERIKDMIAWDAVEKQQMAVGSGMPCVYRTFLLTPDVARDLAATYKSKDAFEVALVETARNPLGARAFANYWGNPGSAFDPAKCPLAQHQTKIAQAEGAKSTAVPPWLAWSGLKTIETVPAMQEGKNIFLVTGDAARNKEQCLPGGGSATIKIALPAAWDKLMSERGYEPLRKFMLAGDLKPDVPRPKVKGYSRPGVRGDVGGMGHEGASRMNDRRPQGGYGRRRGSGGNYGERRYPRRPFRHEDD